MGLKMPARTSFYMIQLLLVCAVLLQYINAVYVDGIRGSYAKYPKWNACRNASISFEFKSAGDGLLMYTDDNGTYDFFEVVLDKGGYM